MFSVNYAEGRLAVYCDDSPVAVFDSHAVAEAMASWANNASLPLEAIHQELRLCADD